MNEQQLAAVKQALETIKAVSLQGDVAVVVTPEREFVLSEAITALQSIISQHALDKKADNARELGLSYDDEPKIGCVNHDCDQCKAVQEPEYWNVVDPAGNIVASETDAIRGWARIAGSYKPTVEGLLGFHDQGWRVLPKVTPPAPQPVPVNTYHDGKPWPVAPVPNGPYSAPIKNLWPVAPKPWVGLTHEELKDLMAICSGVVLYRAIEQRLKEKNT
jgi:hypothetical protein